MPLKSRIRQFFNDIAPNYDRLNHIMSFGIDRSWRRKAVRYIADSGKPLDVLDVACGTGDFAMAIARKLKSGSRVIGVDLSEKMLEYGRKKLPPVIQLEVGDAESLEFEDASFDRVSVAFGVRNFEHLEQGLSEMHRVLRPGGKLVILELSYPDNLFLLGCYKLYALHFLPFIGGLLSGQKEAYAYLPKSILAFPKEGLVVPMLHSAGFHYVEVHKFTFGACVLYVAGK